VIGKDGGWSSGEGQCVSSLPKSPRHAYRFFPQAQATRQFGFVSNFADCLPGDLILFKDRKPSYTSRLIKRGQNLDFAPEDSQWTHAGIFLYRDFVLEAIPWRGVHTRTLYDDIPRRMLRIRKNPNLSQRPALRTEHATKEYRATLRDSFAGATPCPTIWNASHRTLRRTVKSAASRLTS
jgi:hypothetical protein